MADVITVAELIAKLKRMPEAAHVYVQDTQYPDEPAVPLHKAALIRDEAEEWVLLM